jgi:hypothetical protein
VLVRCGPDPDVRSHHNDQTYGLEACENIISPADALFHWDYAFECSIKHTTAIGAKPSLTIQEG